jgi:adenosylmethionine-8-amino-7-oxononanoate aminotransferase
LNTTPGAVGACGIVTVSHCNDSVNAAVHSQLDTLPHERAIQRVFAGPASGKPSSGGDFQ